MADAPEDQDGTEATQRAAKQDTSRVIGPIASHVEKRPPADPKRSTPHNERR